MSKNAQATAKKIATNLAKRLPNSHADVLEALQKTQFIAMNKGLNPFKTGTRSRPRLRPRMRKSPRLRPKQ